MKEKVPRQQECPICKGWAFIDIELPADQGNHTTEDCGYCLGTGYIAKESIDRARTASRLRKIRSAIKDEKARALFSFRLAMDYREKIETVKETAMKYRDAYCAIAAPTYGHHVESMKKAERLPWEVES